MCGILCLEENGEGSRGETWIIIRDFDLQWTCYVCRFISRIGEFKFNQKDRTTVLYDIQ